MVETAWLPPWDELSWKKVRDHIYGYIYFNEVEKILIDNPYVQRLRYIYQTQLSRLVYPAEHTRFYHSLGVMHLMGIASQKLLHAMREEGGLEEGELRTLTLASRIAGLLHDVGHIFMSHWSEELVRREIPAELRPYSSHEELGLKLYRDFISERFRREVDNPPVLGKLEKLGIDLELLDKAVRALLEPLGRSLTIRDIKEKVSRQLGGGYADLARYVVPLVQVLKAWFFTVDEVDYLMRDGASMGVVEYGTVDWRRLLDETGVYLSEDAYVLCIRSWRRFIPTFLRFLESYLSMYRYCYFHKTIKAFERVLHELQMRYILKFLRDLKRVFEEANEDKLIKQLYEFVDAVQLKNLLVDNLGRFNGHLNTWAEKFISRRPPVKLLYEAHIPCRDLGEYERVSTLLNEVEEGLNKLLEEGVISFNVRLATILAELARLGHDKRNELMRLCKSRKLLLGGFYVAKPSLMKYDLNQVFMIDKIHLTSLKLSQIIEEKIIPPLGRVPILVKFLAFHDNLMGEELRKATELVEEIFYTITSTRSLGREEVFPP